MGFLDLFRTKAQPTKNVQKKPVTDGYYGDLNKTSIIFDLINVPQEDRDDLWRENFLKNIIHASFRCGDPQVISGPDGFPYVQLLMPKTAESFQCYVIDHMKDDFLLDRGYGVVINPEGGQPDWVLTYGDIVNLDLNGTFYTSGPSLFSAFKQDETIEGEENVLVGAPSNLILTSRHREILREFLKGNGILTPKVFLMSRTVNGTVSQELVFNLTPDNFETEEDFRYVMQSLGWFLPRHYSFVGMDEERFQDSFMPL